MENGYQYRGNLLRQCMHKKKVKNNEFAKILGCSSRIITISGGFCDRNEVK